MGPAADAAAALGLKWVLLQNAKGRIHLSPDVLGIMNGDGTIGSSTGSGPDTVKL